MSAWTWRIAFCCLGGIVGLTGCDPDPISAQELCDLECGCTHCTPSLAKTCVQSIERASSTAEAEGCANEFGDVAACFLQQGCSAVSMSKDSPCKSLDDALIQCVSKSNSDPCTLAAAHFTDCTGDTAKVPASCTARDQCEASCLLDADCAAINGTSPKKEKVLKTCFKDCMKGAR